MKITRKLISVLACVPLVVCVVQGQGTFQNLNFELPTLIPVPGDPYGRVQFTPAFPGWTGYIGPIAETLALYNNMFLDSTGLGLQGPNSGFNIEGNYTAMIQSGYALSGPPTQVNASLSQSGVLPIDARSLQFRATGLGPFDVALNGQSLSLIPLSSMSGYTLYGADVSAFAGLATEFRFTALPRPSPPIISTFFLDAIVFSNQPIPEPGSIGLLALGALLLGWRLRSRLS